MAKRNNSHANRGGQQYGYGKKHRHRRNSRTGFTGDYNQPTSHRKRIRPLQKDVEFFERGRHVSQR